MANFKPLQFDVADGDYTGTINAYKLSEKGHSIQLEIDVDNADYLLRAGNFGTGMCEQNPLFRYFQQFGYTLDDVSEIEYCDLIGEKIHFRIEHKQGKTRTFCNIVEMNRLNEEGGFQDESD